jgi:hypothetical protein
MTFYQLQVLYWVGWQYDDLDGELQRKGEKAIMGYVAAIGCRI